MKSFFWSLLLVFALSIGTWGAARTPTVRVIFDTDMGNDIDDALALAMLHALESRGELKLVAVTVTKDNQYAARYVDLVNTFYGRGDIPIGVVKNGKTPDDSPMIRVPAERKNPDGSYVYPHDLRDGTQAPEAVGLLRRILSKEEDGAVTIIQVGFSTNLARLLDSPGDTHSPSTGKELVRRKVRWLSIMAGAFPTGKPEFNVHTDLSAAKKLFADWPTPIVASGFEIGLSILYPAKSIGNHYAYVKSHPIAEAYRNYQRMPYDRPTWDLTSVLYAIRPNDGYFDLSAPGTISAQDDGKTSFQPSVGGTHRYLMAPKEKRLQILESLIHLSSQPPDHCRTS
jgi:inosine-uridine nucleoside N-ribohydrolase